jgi:di/tricarboxylate transporter
VSDVGIVYTVLGAIVVLFVWNRLPVEVVAIGSALALVATDVLELDQALAGFGDATVLFIASLFVVSESLDRTGVTTWAGQQLVRFAGESRVRLMVLMILLVALLTALISVNGAVAALLPVVVVLAVRLGRAPSQLMMPLAFGAHAGSMLALTGTPVNVLVSDAAADAGEGRFSFFSFTLVGVPLVAGTILIVVLFGPTLLPTRTPRSVPADLSEHARVLGAQYLGDRRVFRLLVGRGSELAGRSVGELADRLGDDCEIVGVQRNGDGALERDGRLAVGDLVVVRADVRAVAAVVDDGDVDVYDVPFDPRADGLLDRRLGVAEVVVPPRSGIVGDVVFPGMVTESGDLVVLAVQRQGRDVGVREVTLEPGDVLLVQGAWDRLDLRIGEDSDVIVVDEPELVRRQAVPLGPKSTEAIVVTLGMVLLLATGVVPAVVAGLLAAGAMILLGVLSIDQAYRGITWTTVVLVAAMIPLSTAMTQTGAAEEIASRLVDAVGDSSPYLLLLGLFALTAVLGQLISNMATALVVIPVAVSAATELDVSVRPVLMCVTVAAAAALLTPVATPANLMVMGPGGYRFADYWKLGLPLLALYLVLAVLYVPLVWGF